MAPFFYGDYCLGLLNTQYSLPASETFEVFYEPPPAWADRKLGHVDVQLAYSRDGRNWLRPDDRTPVIPNGGPGSEDEGTIFIPQANPFTVDGDTYIYYTGVRYQHNDRGQRSYMEAHDHDMRDGVSCMLAKMPEDHWVSLDAGDSEGSFTCKAWGPPHEVFVNADAAGGDITAELVTPYGEPVPGCTRADCIPITGNGKDQQVRWPAVPHPWDLHSDYLGGVLVRFYLRNAKLYSYTFTLPDPSGQLELDRQNARWCDHIRHRSDNWDRAANEPAIGKPPHPDSPI